MKQDISPKTRERYEFIETQLFWGDGVTARGLAEAFEISRQVAQGVIDSYRRAYPGQMRYDTSLKCHKPSETFEAVFIRKKPLAVLDYLRGQALIGHYRMEDDWIDIELTDVDRLLRPDLPLEPTRTVLAALRLRQVVEIDYRSKKLESNSISPRLISPNHLVFADNRYHLRSYCHTRHDYRDFVLSRISYAEIIQGEEWVSSHYDSKWNEIAELRFKPNSKLPEETRKALLINYQNQEGSWIIVCKKALAFYIKRNLQSNDQMYGVPLWVLEKDST